MNFIPQTEWGQGVTCCDAAPDSIAVTDTTEVRWFAAGSLPGPVLGWFMTPDTTTTVEDRCDTYQIDHRPDVGVKWRHRSTLELKIRQSIGRRLALTEGPVGHTESWRKWSPADEIVARPGPPGGRIDVHKTVTRHILAPLGDAGSPSLAECHVEVTAIQVAGIDAWSFAFSAVGLRQLRLQSIVAAWDALNGRNAAPRELVTNLSICSGYPAWLSGLVTR